MRTVEWGEHQMGRAFRRSVFAVVCWFACVAQAQNPAVTINVDVQANRHAINPLVYGVNLFENPNVTTILQDLNAPINRYGGNRASTYNWITNSDNRGNDYYFESISDDNQTTGERVDTFVTLTRNAGAEPMVTIPMLDWVGTAGTWPYPCSYPLATFPNQAAFDPDNANCGDGLLPDKTRIDGADPNLTFVANSLANQQSWVQHVIGAFGASANGGVRYYVLDNEHDLWSDTHHDVVATGPSYTADRDKMILYAAMVKAKDANALIVGPEMSGWIGYVYSPADRDYAPSVNWDSSQFPDRIAMNGSDYAPWLLGQFKAYADAHNGQRLLDFFTVHYYPQGGDMFVNTRSLWDPNYVDPSYINDTIQLIPRLKQWVAANYPGTKIGVTEYNWCNINDEANTDNIGCAIAQADVLGIFGREGLDMATRFNAPIPNLPSYNAMKMFRNYDGSMSTFGDVSTSATVANPDTVAAFAAQRTSDGKITAMLLSKYAAGNTAATVQLANFAASGTAQVWQLSGDGSAIQQLADTTLSNSNVALTLPPQSVTLLVISAVQAAPTVSSISPVSGPAAGGTSITITGTNFVSGATVTVGGTAATSVAVNSATQITATTAAHTAGAVNVVVTNPDGQTSTLANGYTYVAAAAPPVISTVSPSSGPAVGGTAITITGSGFQGGATVSIGGTAATGVTVVNATQITATTPAHVAGTVNVAVTNPDILTGTLSNGYTYVAAPAVSLSATTITFGAQRMNTSTAASSVTLTNSGTASLTIGSVTVSGSLSETDNCPTSLSAGANCVIALAPTALSETPGVLTISDSAADSPQHVSVSGRGDLLITIARPPRPTRSATQTVKISSARPALRTAPVAETAPAPMAVITVTLPDSPSVCETPSMDRKKSLTEKRQAECEHSKDNPDD